MSEAHGSGRVDSMGDAMRAFRVAARLAPDADIRPERVVALAGTLLRLAYGLDQIAWGTWKKMAPTSTVRRGAGLAEAVASDLEGRGASADAKVERLRMLVFSLLSSVSQVGHFAVRELGRLGPERIEDGVSAGGFGRDSACWRRYKELAGAYDEDQLEASMLGSMTEYVEAMLAGGARSQVAASGADA